MKIFLFFLFVVCLVSAGERSVLLLGRVMVSKSTIGNMLYNDDVDMIDEPFKTCRFPGERGCTEEIGVLRSERIGYTILDLPGIGNDLRMFEDVVRDVKRMIEVRMLDVELVVVPNKGRTNFEMIEKLMKEIGVHGVRTVVVDLGADSKNIKLKNSVVISGRIERDDHGREERRLLLDQIKNLLKFDEEFVLEKEDDQENKDYNQENISSPSSEYQQTKKDIVEIIRNLSEEDQRLILIEIMRNLNSERGEKAIYSWLIIAFLTPLLYLGLYLINRFVKPGDFNPSEKIPGPRPTLRTRSKNQAPTNERLRHTPDSDHALPFFEDKIFDSEKKKLKIINIGEKTGWNDSGWVDDKREQKQRRIE